MVLLPLVTEPHPLDTSHRDICYHMVHLGDMEQPRPQVLEELHPMDMEELHPQVLQEPRPLVPRASHLE